MRARARIWAQTVGTRYLRSADVGSRTFWWTFVAVCSCCSSTALCRLTLPRPETSPDSLPTQTQTNLHKLTLYTVYRQTKSVPDCRHNHKAGLRVDIKRVDIWRQCWHFSEGNQKRRRIFLGNKCESEYVMYVSLSNISLSYIYPGYPGWHHCSPRMKTSSSINALGFAPGSNK